MNNTPKFWTRLFEWLCDDSFFEELQGDLEERYFINQEKFGDQKAKAVYRKEVLKMVRPSVLKLKNKLPGLFNVSLLRIHLILSLRNLKRNKVYSTINILGLGAALSVCMFIVNMVLTGLSEDHQHPENDRFYRILTQESKRSGFQINSATNPTPLIEILKTDLPEIEIMSIVAFGPTYKFDWGNEGLPASSILVDDNFFELFNFEILEGNPSGLFDDLNSIVITEEIARKVFPDKSAIGKTTLDGKVIKAVIENPKTVSHLDFQALGYLPSEKLNRESVSSDLRNWEPASGEFIYFRLNDQLTQSQLDAKLLGISKSIKAVPETKNRSFIFSSQLVKDITFGKFITFDYTYVVSKSLLFPILLLGLIILLIAVFNYTNLSIARGIQRTKEIGIRKINGSTELQIVGQFLTETVLFSAFAFVLALISYRFFAMTFSSVLEEISGVFAETLDTKLVFSFFIFSLLIGIVVGILPALHFARINPLDAVKAKLLKNRLSVPTLRKVLTGSQLTISMLAVLLMAFGNNIYQQVLRSDLGFNYEGVVTFKTHEIDTDVLQNELSKITSIKAFSLSSFTPGVDHNTSNKAYYPNSRDTIIIYKALADYNISAVYDLKILKGNQPEKLTKTSDQILVNPLFLQRLQIPIDSAINHEVLLSGYRGQPAELKYIGGVMDDFVRNALESYKIPFVIELADKDAKMNIISIDIDSKNLNETLEEVNEVYSTLSTKSTFEPIFTEDEIKNSYALLTGIIKTIWFLGICVILIAVLGQLGMALYNAERRTKEIGIRKVLGASRAQLLKLLLGGTLQTLVIALLISAPLAYSIIGSLLMLEISVDTHISLIAGIEGVLGLTGLVVGVILLQTLRTARLNPSVSLRNE
ncbi:FtsX-like permease family protein [Roseivirga sp.]|uniref:FtsX-like permease family protein n=1 Tax=Roseivirga sp. TaxID=1964215 RepID=UPI003B8AD6C2